MKIQICGVKTKEEILTASYEGADALCFLIGTSYKTYDEVSVDTFQKLIKIVPVFVTPIIFTYFSSPEGIITLYHLTKIKNIQISEKVLPEDIKRIKNEIPDLTVIQLVKADKNIKEKVNSVASIVDMFNIDCKDLAVNSMDTITKIQDINRPVILSNASKEIVELIKPYAVSLNGEVSNSNGGKDPELIRKYISELKGITKRNYSAFWREFL